MALVQYYFHNLTSNQPNTEIIPKYGTISVPRFNWFEEKIVIKMFKHIIELNSWDENHHIRAAPDDLNSSAIEYKDGTIEYNTFEDHLEMFDYPVDNIDNSESDEETC